MRCFNAMSCTRAPTNGVRTCRPVHVSDTRCHRFATFSSRRFYVEARELHLQGSGRLKAVCTQREGSWTPRTLTMHRHKT